jgi:hypothetical protein
MSAKKQNGKQGKPAVAPIETNGSLGTEQQSHTAGSAPQSGRPEWKPNVEFFTSLSADGRFLIFKTVITAIKPVRYLEKVMGGRNQAVDGQGVPSKADSPEKAG